MSSSYDSSEEEFDMEEEEDLAMILAMHINKKPKHGGSVMGRQKIWRDRIDAHNRLMRHYFVKNPTYPESYFRRRFRMSTEFTSRKQGIGSGLASPLVPVQTRTGTNGCICPGSCAHVAGRASRGICPGSCGTICPGSWHEPGPMWPRDICPGWWHEPGPCGHL